MRPLTVDQRETILALTAEGLTVEAVAALAGCSRRSISRWRRRGEQEVASAEERDFAWRYMQAEALAEISLVKLIWQAATVGGDGDWGAAAWLLARRWPERWSERRKLKIDYPPEQREEVHRLAESIRRLQEKIA